MNTYGVAVWLCLMTSCSFFGDDQGQQYTVVKGDTLTRIAQQYGVTVTDLRRWNQLTSDRIDVGQVLSVGPGIQVQAGEVAVSKPHKGSQARKSSSRQPKEKRCLKGPSIDDLDDDTPDIRSSVGLTRIQIRSALDGALNGLSRCFSSGWPNGVVDLEFRVGCNGLVADIRVLDATGVPEDAVRCMVTELRTVGFPAHDMPDGMVFRYPVTLAP